MANKIQRDAKLWKMAKAIARKAHKASNYRYINAQYKALSLDPKTLDAIVPTRGTEDIIEALDELRDCLEHYILDMFVPECQCQEGCPCDCNPGYAWVCVESLTTTSAIVELRGLGDGDFYYSVDYTRDEAGDFVFGLPVQVEEITTYVPVLAPPPVATMARGSMLFESFAVHAPAAEGLTPGHEVQLLRNGPLHDMDDGAFVLDVTDALCQGIAESAALAGFGIPIDFGHSLYRAQVSGQAQDSIPLYGRISKLDARPGEGLWGTPEWTDTGVQLLNSKPGLLYLSPTLLGQPHNPNTGEPMSGRGLHSVSITPTPRQNDLASLALDRVSKLTTLDQGVPMDKSLIYALAGIEVCHQALSDLASNDAPEAKASMELALAAAEACKAFVASKEDADKALAAEACKAAAEALAALAPYVSAVCAEVASVLAPAAPDAPADPEVEVAPAPAEVPAAPMAKPSKAAKNDMTKLLDRVKAADATVLELTTQLGNLTTEKATLLAKVSDLETSLAGRDFADLITHHDQRGVVIGEGLKTTLASLALEQAATILSNMTPTRPHSPIGTAGIPPEPKVRTEEQIISDAHVIMSTARKDGKPISFGEAVNLSRKAV